MTATNGKTPFQALREPFPADKVEKLPRAANKQAKLENKRGNCSVCGKYHVLPAIHLDYVSHATVTDRLLLVDPEWTWEPMGRQEDGSPRIVTNDDAFSDPDAKVGLWIVLKIVGTDTPGFGEGKNIKEAISDAIRNAAMRRGVALDLWAKVDLDAPADPEVSTPPRKTAAPASPSSAGAAAPPAVLPVSASQKTSIKKLVAEIAPKHEGVSMEAVLRGYGGDLANLTSAQAEEIVGKLEKLKATVEKDAA